MLAIVKMFVPANPFNYFIPLKLSDMFVIDYSNLNYWFYVLSNPGFIIFFTHTETLTIYHIRGNICISTCMNKKNLIETDHPTPSRLEKRGNISEKLLKTIVELIFFQRVIGFSSDLLLDII